MVFNTCKVVTTLCILAVSISCIWENQDSTTTTKRKIEASLRSGDLAFRRGRGVISDAVISADHCGHYSHTGIIVERENQWYVIHEVPYEGRSRINDKIYCQPIELFFRDDKAKAGAVYRVGIDSTSISKIVNYLDRQLALEIPFDHAYDLEDSTSLYCTELVWRAFNLAGIDLTEGRRTNLNLPGMGGEKIFPTDIELNKKLKLICRF